MKKKPIGFIIPYYKNTEECEIYFKKLMENISKQIETTQNLLIVVIEDGQKSKWLDAYASEIIKIHRNDTNKGVSYCRNWGIDYLIDKVNYIGFIDSDDSIASDYLEIMCKYALDHTYDLLELLIYVNEQRADYTKEGQIRNAVWSYAFNTEIIGNKRFDENLQFYEDANFTHDVIDLEKQRKVCVPAIYYYYYKRNPLSLSARFAEDPNVKYRNL